MGQKQEGEKGRHQYWECNNRRRIIMVQEMPGVLLKHNNKRAIHHLFAFVVTVLIFGSCFTATSAVSGGITSLRPLDHDHEGREEPCAFPVDDSPCRTQLKSFRNRLVAGEEESFRKPRRAQEFKSSINVEEVDASLRQVRHTGGAEDLTTVGVAVRNRRTEGAKRRWLEADEYCTKVIRGRKFGSCRGSEAGRAGGAVALRVLRAAGAATGGNDAEASVLLGWRAALSDGPKHVFANWNLTTEPNWCQWRGVECANATQQPHVISIILAGYKLSGSIPSGLSGLPFLATLDLSYNHLVGEIPGDLANISTLQTLDLSYNRVNGTIPSFGASQSSLQSLNLMRNKLSGVIPASLGQCPQLTDLNLAHNNLGGNIPSELGTLSNLQRLFLYQNKLVGYLPSSLGSCAGLVNMSLGWNQLSGLLPDSYSKLEALEGLYLHGNNFSGPLPDWLANLPNVSDLHLYMNGFVGPIPPMLGNSKQLRSLNLSNNHLENGIPTALAESSNLLKIDLSWNRLSGAIPEEFGYLNQLQLLHLEHNFLEGLIPASLGDCVQLTEIVLSSNLLSGPVPNPANLLQLQVLSLDQNQLNGTIPATVVNCVNLTVLDLSVNCLRGAIPGDIGQLKDLTVLRLSTNSLGGFLPDMSGLVSLRSLTLDHNLFTGTIPKTLCSSVQLQVLSLGSNSFLGNIPGELSQCSNLTTLTLDNNSLNGSIPDSLGDLELLTVLYLHRNMLTGPIPLSFNNLTQLRDLVISDNQINGQIPAPLLSIFSQLQANFSVANNLLSGSLPRELGLLTLVQTMNLSGNNFSGGIPDDIGNCTSLVNLDLAGNNLTGGIPPTIDRLSALESLNLSHNVLTDTIPAMGDLSNLGVLDLSANNLSGGIPPSLSSLPRLLFFNVSDNLLRGPVPSDGAFQNFSASSFFGNPGLCGPILEINCGGPSPAGHSRRSSLPTAAWIGIALGILGLVAFLVVAAGFVWWRIAAAPGTRENRGSIIARSELFYPQLRFTVQDLKLATENFSDVNVLGVGSLSSVYRGVLPELVLVAVKKLKVVNGTEIPPEFIQELDVLGKLRDPHLVAIVGHCFEPEMNALVVQFMSNGSLEHHLHGGPTCDLEWPIRAKVAIGVAKALNYLHNENGATFVHCDLKPSNVLLDADFNAHLEDFGLSRLIFAHKLMDMTNSSVGSSMGYFPPEYGYSPTVSPKGDVYSYGILLLELLTGKKPTLDMFPDDMSLTAWCQASFPSKTLDVLDSTLIGSKETNLKQVNLFMKVALMCAKDAPDERPTMKNVLDMLR